MAEPDKTPARSFDKRWRGGASHLDRTAPGSGRKSRALKLGIVVLALGGLLAGLLTYVRPAAEPYFLSVPIREYDSILFPTNPCAVQDGKALAQHFNEKFAKPAFESQTLQRLVKELEALRKQADHPLVVHLTCLATVRHGEVLLLPGDAQPGEESSWLPLKTVLDLVASCPSAGKLLILDIAHPVADARLGILNDYVMEQAAKLLADQKSMYVLASCGPGQMSHVADELHTVIQGVEQTASVFAYYLDQGLRGAADGWGPAPRLDKRITVTELADFVRTRTERWSEQNRRSRQTPCLWGKSADFVLVTLDDVHALLDPTPADDSYPASLQKGWLARDALLQKQAYHDGPEALHQIDAGLLRLERRWRGGYFPQPTKDVPDPLTKDVDDLFKTNPTTKPAALSLARRSLALDAAQSATAVEAPTEKLRDLLVKVGAAPPKEEAVAKFKEVWQTMLKEAKDVPPGLYAAALVEAAGQLADPEPRQLAFVRDAIGQALPERTYWESIWIRRLLDLSIRMESKTDWKWSELPVKQSLRALRARETLVALLSGEPGVLPQLDKLFLQADKERREGERTMLWERPLLWPEADAALRQAAEEYEDLAKRIVRFQAARRTVESACARLPGYVGCLSAAEAPQEEKLWLRILDETQRFLDAWTAPAAKDSTGDGARLTTDLIELTKMFEARARALIQLGVDGDAGDVEAIEGLLATPNLPAGLRLELWNAGRALRTRLLERSLKRDEQERTAPQSAPSALPRAEESWPAQAASAQRRARLSLALLKLGGVQTLGPAFAELEKSKGKSEPAAYEPLAQLIGNAWLVQAPEQLRSKTGNDADKQSLAQLRAERLRRALPLVAPPIRGGPDAAPAQSRRAADHLLLRRWLADRYRDEAQFLRAEGSKESPEASKFFDEAAREVR